MTGHQTRPTSLWRIGTFADFLNKIMAQGKAATNGMNFMNGGIHETGISPQLMRVFKGTSAGGVLSFVAQSLHRIDPGRPARREVAGHECDRSQDNRHEGEGGGIE